MPDFSSSSALVAARNSRSGAPSNFEPMSSRSLMFLSVNGTAQSYGRVRRAIGPSPIRTALLVLVGRLLLAAEHALHPAEQALSREVDDLCIVLLSLGRLVR